MVVNANSDDDMIVFDHHQDSELSKQRWIYLTSKGQTRDAHPVHSRYNITDFDARACIFAENHEHEKNGQKVEIIRRSTHTTSTKMNKMTEKSIIIQ